MESNINKRDYAIDLLRFICILMVVTGHYFLHGGLRTSAETSHINMMIANILCTLCRVAVNVFFIITGFFTFKKNTEDKTCNLINSISKSVILDTKMIIYGVVLYLIFYICGLIDFNAYNFITNFLPLSTNRYWFITTYICLILLLPFISDVKNYDNKSFCVFVFLLLFIDSILPLLGFSSVKGIEYSVFHAITMAVVGMGIARFEYIFKKCSIFVFLLFYLLLIFAAVGMNVVCPFKVASFAEYNSILVILSSASFFIFMKSFGTRLTPPHCFLPFLHTYSVFTLSMTMTT